MTRRRAKDPKRHTLCLRLTAKQLSVLQLYAGVKGFDTEVDALRHIINGLEAWLEKQDADVDDGPEEELGAAVPAMEPEPGVM